MKQIEVKAKTLHEAIEDACTQLGVSQEDLNIEVLSQGGMFGKVKILASVKEEAIKKPEPTKEPEPTKAPEPVQESKPAPKQQEPSQSTSIIPAPTQSITVVETKPEPKPFVPKGNPPSPTGTNKFDKTTAFVTRLLELLENDSVVTTEVTENSFNINVNGEHIGRLIGKNGAVLNAIQTIVSSIAISNSNGEGKRVFVNVGDYKEKRGDTLQSIAQKKAEYVKRTGRFVKLDPMNPRDRAIVHTALQNVEGIKTYSTGRDPFRCLCIAPADGTEKKFDKKSESKSEESQD